MDKMERILATLHEWKKVSLIAFLIFGSKVREGLKTVP